MREKIWVKLQKGLLGKQILRKPRKKDGKKSVGDGAGGVF